MCLLSRKRALEERLSEAAEKKGKCVFEACVAEDDKSDFSLACVSSVTSTDEWLCDSACSFHMCFRKEWFFNFTELDGGVVYLADNQPCKIAGIGSISLKIHDGMTRLLKDVRYIPKLEKNLISFGTLESKGFTIILQNGILKVVSGALVVMKGIRRNNLYLYQGSTMLSDQNAFTNRWHYHQRTIILIPSNSSNNLLI